MEKEKDLLRTEGICVNKPRLIHVQDIAYSHILMDIYMLEKNWLLTKDGLIQIYDYCNNIKLTIIITLVGCVDLLAM